MGSSNPVSDIMDTAGSLVSSAGNAIGSAVDFVANNADVALPIIVAATTGDPLLAADTFGSSTAADIAANEAASAAAAAAGTDYGLLSGDAAYTDYASTPMTQSQIDALNNQNIDYNSAINQMEPQGGTGSSGTLYDNTANLPSSGILNTIQNLFPSSTTISNVFSSIAKAAPLAGAGILGKLAYSDQARINQAVMDAYNTYLNKQSGIASAYGVGAGPQKLPYTIGGIPLAQAQPRTAANVVNIPRAADGGILSKKNPDMLNEYMDVRNRLKKYKMGGRAHYAMGGTNLPMQQGMTPDKQQLRELFTKRPDILKKVLAFKQLHESGFNQPATTGLKQGGIPEIDYRDKGGYVPPIGKKERADDIPAMLSNNEFVFTANAVRNAGGGDVKEGAKKMYALMKKLEGGMA